MIRVNVQSSTQGIMRLTIEGHALTGDPGYDLVCAGVSSIAIGALNGLDALAQGLTLTMSDEPKIEIQCNTINKNNQLLLQFLILQLKTVEEEYGDAIRIEEVKSYEV